MRIYDVYNEGATGPVARDRHYWEGQLRYAQNVAEYLLFLAETTGMASPEACLASRAKLGRYQAYSELVRDIAPR